MPLNPSPSPGTMTPPKFFFQLLAASSKTFSARPSSRHPEPQCFPMNVANACRADDESVRLCFFVNVRKAKGLRVVGGRIMGNIDGLDGSGALEIRMG